MRNLIDFNAVVAENYDKVMVSSNDEGIEKVIENDGKYAYLMEDSTIQYQIERNCKVTQVGGPLDNKVREKLTCDATRS